MGRRLALVPPIIEKIRFSALLGIASGKERPRNDIASLVGEGTYIFTNPKGAKEH